MQISLKIIRSINHAKSTVCIKFQLIVTSSSLFTASSSLPVFPPSVLYVGQTIRPIAIRGKEQRAAEKGNWHYSSITQHKETCKEEVDWQPEVITTMQNKNKKKLTRDLKVREALEICRHNCGPGRGLNEDYGA